MASTAWFSRGPGWISGWLALLPLFLETLERHWRKLSPFCNSPLPSFEHQPVANMHFMACLPATSLEVTLDQNDCSRAATQDESWLGHLWRSLVTREVSGDSDVSSQLVLVLGWEGSPLLSYVLQLLCLHSGCKDFVTDWQEWSHSSVSSASEVTLYLLIAYCSTSYKCPITENKQTKRELGKDRVAFSQTASPDVGLFKAHIHLPFLGVLFSCWLPGEYELEECTYFDLPHNWFQFLLFL